MSQNLLIFRYRNSRILENRLAPFIASYETRKRVMTSTANEFIKRIQDPPKTSSNKITVVGAGAVGQACAFALLTQKVTNHVCIVDRDDNRIRAEALDLMHGSACLGNCRVIGSTDYALTAGSKLCIFTAGTKRIKVDQTRLDLAQESADLVKVVVQQLLRYSPDTVLLMVSNPCDVLARVAWELSELPKEQVIASGTHLDTSRFRYLLSQKFGIGQDAVHGWIIGEHGDSSVPVWSSVTIGGVNLIKHANHNDDELHCIHQEVVNGGYEVLKLKGYTNWAVSLVVADIANAIIHDTGSVKTVSIFAKGYHGIEDDVWLSLPVALGSNGVRKVIEQPLTDEESDGLQNSAKVLVKTLQTIVIK